MENLIRKFLEEHVLFKDYANPDFISSLVVAMKPRIYVDGAHIIKKGEIGRAMFFILKGTVDVVSEDGEMVSNVMTEGSFFGEIGVLYSVPRTASCLSHGKSIILILTKEALAKALEPYPKIAQSISMIAEQRYANHIKKKENSVVDEFGDELRVAITQQELQNVSIFKDASIGFLHCLSMSLKPVKFFRNQIVFRKGDSASAMYFVAKGTAQAVDETGSVVYAQFPPASFFGEVGLFLENQKRTATIQCSSEDMLLFMCDKVTIDKLLREFPEVQGKITSELQRRMEYIKHREQSKLSPDQMQATEIESVREKLQTISLFKGAALGFVHSLAVDVKVSRYHPGAIIFQEGEPAESMYFIVDGVVQIVGKNGDVFAESGTNSYFGEVSLLYDICRTATVKSKTETTMLELGKKALESALIAYPSAENSLREVAKDHYERHLKRKEILKSQSSLLSRTEHTIPERLRKTTIFKNCSDEFLHTLGNKMELIAYKNGELICKRGEIARSMFFIIEGYVEVVSDDLKTVYDRIETGDFFGETGVLNATKRNATVLTRSDNTVLLILSGEEIQSTLAKFPDSYESIVLASTVRSQKASGRDQNSLKNSNSTRSFTASTTDLLGEELAAAFKLENVKTSKEARVTGNIFITENDPTKISRIATEESSVEMFTIPKRTFSSDDVNITSDRTSLIKNILDVNEYELSIILKRVPFVKLMSSLRRVCKKWNKQLASSHFCKMLNLEASASELSNQFLTNTSLFANSQLTHLNISGCGRITDDGIGVLVGNCKNIVSLAISNCWKLTDISIKHIGTLSEMIQLDISHCNKLNGSGFLQHKMAKLKTLNCSYCKALSDKSLEKLLSNTPDITEVYIRRCTRITEFGIFLIIRFCRKIKKLDARDLEQLSDRCLKWIATACFQLVSINFAFCRNLTYSGFQEFAQGAQKYKALDFTNCTQVTDSVIFLLKDCISELKFLSLKNCPKITDAIGSHLALRARKLKVLDVTGCDSVTPRIKIIIGTMNKRINIVMRKTLKERNIVPPGYPGNPAALEIHPRELFTSGPGELLKLGVLTNHNVKANDVNVKKFLKVKGKKGGKRERRPSIGASGLTE